MARRILVIGGVAGGAGAAVKARRTDEFAEITMLERGPYVSWANCGLPYALGGEIPEREDLFLVGPERFAQRFQIDVRLQMEATSIKRDIQEVRARNRVTGKEEVFAYDQLILATGGLPLRPPIPGVGSENIYTLTTITDLDQVMERLKESPQRAVVIGGGFIGLETAEALVHRGLAVTVVELAPQLLPPFDPEMVWPIQEHLKENGVEVVLGDGVAEFLPQGGLAKAIRLKSSREIPMDLAILSVGVRPELTLAREAGLSIGSQGVLVNERMQTSDERIYAAGDIVESIHLVTGERVRLPLAGPANRQARVAGANAAGGEMRYSGAMGTSIVKVLDWTAAKCGLAEKEVGNRPHYISYTHSLHHAGYYPGAKEISIKLIVAEDGRLLGAQAVGQAGVDKRIDVLATAIHAGMSVCDLEELDLAYAPPYGSAKDPVHIAGMAAANILRKEVRVVHPAQIPEGIQIVDLRTEGEYQQGHISGAICIPINDLRQRIGELEKRPTVTYCGVGYRSYLATRILSAHGFDVQNLSGGYQAWVMVQGSRGN